jgi:hypothetical protein
MMFLFVMLLLCFIPECCKKITFDFLQNKDVYLAVYILFNQIAVM